MIDKNNYVCVRVAPKKHKDIINLIRHDTRMKEVSHLRTIPNSLTFRYKVNENGYLECSNFFHNDEKIQKLMIDAKENVEQQKKLYYEKVKQKRQSHTNDFITGIIVFSNTDGIDIEKLRERANRFMTKLYSRYNSIPLYLSEHRDEKTIHYHFALPNQNATTAKSIAQKIDKIECSVLQDIARDTFADLGFERGETADKWQKRRKHYDAVVGREKELAMLKDNINNSNMEYENISNRLLSEKSKLSELLKDKENIEKNTKVLNAKYIDIVKQMKEEGENIQKNIKLEYEKLKNVENQVVSIQNYFEKLKHIQNAKNKAFSELTKEIESLQNQKLSKDKELSDIKDNLESRKKERDLLVEELKNVEKSAEEKKKEYRDFDKATKNMKELRDLIQEEKNALAKDIKRMKDITFNFMSDFGSEKEKAEMISALKLLSKDAVLQLAEVKDFSPESMIDAINKNDYAFINKVMQVETNIYEDNAFNR